MYTYYLRFSYQKTLSEVLFEKLLKPSGEEYLIPKYTSVDVIGRLYKPTGDQTIDEEGVVYPTMKMQTGFYANVRHKDPAPELEQYQVFPLTPERVWA